ncbi:unnamed protein product, partial [marine sediment metagenome]
MGEKQTDFIFFINPTFFLFKDSVNSSPILTPTGGSPRNNRQSKRIKFEKLLKENDLLYSDYG